MTDFNHGCNADGDLSTAKIRDEIYSSVRGYFEVLAIGAELSDGGVADYAGRSGRSCHR